MNLFRVRGRHICLCLVVIVKMLQSDTIVPERDLQNNFTREGPNSGKRRGL